MAILGTILRPAARVAAMHAGHQVRGFLRAHQRTREGQERLLRQMIDAAADSQFGRDHHLDRVRSYADFTSAVPIGDYESHRPYVDRVLGGEVRALFAAGTEVVMFAVTSGTTGAPKYIPVTRPFLADYRRSWNVFGLLALKRYPQAWLRPVVTITSSARESVSPTGIPCGSISGLLAQTQKWVVRKMYPVPRIVGEIRSPASKYYTAVRCSMVRDVAMLTTANPSSAIRLAEAGRDCAERIIRDVRDGTLNPPDGLPPGFTRRLSLRPEPGAAKRLQELLHRHGELLPRHYWRLNLLCLWTGGTLGLYLPRVRQLYGNVPIRDIGLLASEGRLSVPIQSGTPAGVAEITSNFLEFIPAEQIESTGPDVRRAHELEVGREYFIVLTNRAGLWRYNIDDRVRVTGRLGGSPMFEFLSKGVHACSITGEKLTEHQVVEAMDRAGGALGVAVETFVLQGHFAALPYYELLSEPIGRVGAETLCRRLDEALREINLEYDAKRASGRLGPIRHRSLPEGSFARQEARRILQCRGRAEQYKHKYLMNDIVQDSECDRRQED